MTATRNGILADYWTVRDGEGVLHRALVRRYFDDIGRVVFFEAATGCHPVARHLSNTHRDDWAGADLPRLYLSGHPEFTIVEWRVREIPTCLACVSIIMPDSWI